MREEEIGDLINKGPSTAGYMELGLLGDCKSRYLSTPPKALEC